MSASVVAGGLLLMAPAARADWVLVSVNGTVDRVSKNKSGGGDFQGHYGGDITTSFNTEGRGTIDYTSYAWPQRSGPHEDGESEGGEAVASIKLSNIKVVLEWQGVGTPTKTVYLRFSSSASAEAGAVKYANPTWTVSASNGIGGAGTSQPYENDSRKQEVIADDTPSSQVIKIDTGGGTRVEKDLSITLQADASLTTTKDTPDDGFSAVVYTRVQASTRTADYSLFLSRGGRGKIRGMPGVDIDEKKDEWIDEDGNGHGHSRYSYKERAMNNPGVVDILGGAAGTSLYDDNEVTLSQYFQAIRGSDWSHDSQYTWSPSSPEETATGNSQKLPQGGTLHNPEGIESKWVFMGDGFLHVTAKDIVPRGWYNVPSTGGTNPLVVTYDLTDNSVSPAVNRTAKYSLTLHDEWETPLANDGVSWMDAAGIEHKSETLSEWQYRTLALRGVPTLTTSDPGASWKVTESAHIKVGLKGEFSSGFDFADWFKVSSATSVEADLGIAADYESSAPPPSSKNAAPGSSFQPVLKYKIKKEHWLVDHWVVGGFDAYSGRPDRKTPQSGEVGVVQIEPDWLVVPADGGAATGEEDHPYPTPAPRPSPTPGGAE